MSVRRTQSEDTYSVCSSAERERIRFALDDLLASNPLKATQQCQTLLQYIVDHTLAGEDALLRERVIGKEVFGRRPDYEPGEDPVVRIRAADLRKRLALYYQSLDGIPDVRIEVPSGSYKAVFTWKSPALQTAPVSRAPLLAPPIADVPALSQPIIRAKNDDSLLFSDPSLDSVSQSKLADTVDVPPSIRTSLKVKVWVTLALMVLASLFGWSSWYHSRSDRVLRAFWGPLLDSSKPILISIGTNAVYRVGDKQADDYGRQHHLENWGMEFYPQFDPNQTMASTGLYPAWNSFVALGDVASVSEIVSTFSHFTKSFQERFPEDISFAEVRSSPAVLIGGFNNPMARELTKNYPFVLASRNRIEDRTHPGKVWILNASTDTHDTEDYAILTRVLRQKDNEPFVNVAGMGQYGTLGTTDFICRPEGIEELSAMLGNGWQKHNLQVLLRIKVIDFKPVSSSIIATHTW
jgi:hypothetical protein